MKRKKLYNYLGDDLVEALKDNECFIAGGTITSLFCNREINDIDIYFRSQKHLINFIEDIWGSGHWIIAHTDKATLIKWDTDVELQFIHFNYFTNAEDIFKTFDFSVCMGVYDFKTEEFILHNDFLKHNSQRLLKFNADTSFPIVSALRVQKYEKKGYKISKPEYIRILLDVMNLKIDNYEDLKEQMGGMYGINYDKLFTNMKDNKFDLKEIIDKLKDLILDDDYFKQPENTIQFEDVEDLIDSITKNDIYYVTINDEKYRITNIDTLKPINKNIDKFIEKDFKEWMKDKKFYKWVKKVNSKYFSFYDKNFEYELNKSVRPKVAYDEEFWNYCRNDVLYCGELKEIDDLSYSGNDEAVLIELDVAVTDVVKKEGSQITIKKAKVIREVPKEEYQKYIKD